MDHMESGTLIHTRIWLPASSGINIKYVTNWRDQRLNWLNYLFRKYIIHKLIYFITICVIHFIYCSRKVFTDELCYRVTLLFTDEFCIHQENCVIP